MPPVSFLDSLTWLFNDFNLTGQNVINDPVGSICCNVLLLSETTDDVDSTAFLDLILDIPCCDAMPGSFDAHASILRGVAVVGGDREVGNFGVSEVFYVNTPDDAPDFDSV